MGSVISNFIYSYFMRNLETNVVDVDVGDNALDDYYKLYMYIHNIHNYLKSFFFPIKNDFK